MRAQGTSVFTTGLNNPAKIILAGQSSLLVAEAGTTTPNSGRISLVNRASGARRTLIDGLPSAVSRDGGAPEPSGPGGVKLNGQKLYLTIGTGDNDSYLVLEFSANMLAQAPGRLKLFTSASEPPRILVNNLVTPTSVTRDAPTGRIFVTEKATGRIMRVGAPQAAIFDYFGTGKSNYLSIDVANGNIQWNILKNSVTSSVQTRRVYFGLPTDTTVFGDFDGDLKEDIGVWREGTASNPQSYFYIQLSSNPNPNAIYVQQWGLLKDTPITGDFDGDGKFDIGVFRPSNSTYYALGSSNGQFITQYWDGEQASAPSITTERKFNRELFEYDDSKSIPAGALKDLVITKQSDGTYKAGQIIDSLLKSR